MNPASVQGVTAPQAPLSLLHLIAEDADFRARLESDPVSAFAEHGIQVEAQQAVIPAQYAISQLIEDLADQSGANGPAIAWKGLL